MTEEPTIPPARMGPLSIDALTGLVLTAQGAVIANRDGEIDELTPEQLSSYLAGPMSLVCHARAIARRTGLSSLKAYDILELWAFVHPKTPVLPTPAGIAAALGQPLPEGPEHAALSLIDSAELLLRELSHPGRVEASDPVALAAFMGKGAWPWAPFVLAALGRPEGPTDGEAARNLRVWAHLPEWEGEAPPPPPPHHPVRPEDARQRLGQMLAAGEGIAEDRPEQTAYAAGVTATFDRKPAEGAPNLVLAEAGTGTGKTLGYLAPASVWAEQNGAAVWVSTYTRNLQHQIDREISDRGGPPAKAGRQRVVVRKGRENYLCLQNLEEAIGFARASPGFATGVGLMARWAAVTKDGDLNGDDFPGWLPDLVGRGRSTGLADKRGECTYSACSHYQRCFIERSIRRARKADIVVANHALVMIQTALGGIEDGWLPTRYVFDEGHHLFDAADGAFAAHLSGQETADLRRWLIGADTSRRRSRARGLRSRVEDLIGDREEGHAALNDTIRAAHILPGEGWQDRLKTPEAAAAAGPVEGFLAIVRSQVMARAAGRSGPFALEVETIEPLPGLLEAAKALDTALDRLQRPLRLLADTLGDKLDDEAGQLDSGNRQRIEAARRGIERRAVVDIAAWRSMLASLGKDPADGVVDWFGVDRIDGREIDTGYFRHWVDPMAPFAQAIQASAHGVLVTSATLTDGTGEDEQDWLAAERRTGAAHFLLPPQRTRVPSPFNYPDLTRVFVVTDVRKDDLQQVAAAYRALFLAAEGGALGLFTAISRLRAVHGSLAPALEAAGIPLFAQHLDGMDVATLVEIFRGQERSCLLGTDAVRDGVDVPGRSLRLIVFDRVPWPRPTILHRARRDAFGGRAWDDELTRLKLKQAYGRLVRRADDRGIFVLLDPMMPTRLASAFPPGVTVERIGLADAVAGVQDFLGTVVPE